MDEEDLKNEDSINHLNNEETWHQSEDGLKNEANHENENDLEN